MARGWWSTGAEDSEELVTSHGISLKVVSQTKDNCRLESDAAKNPTIDQTLTGDRNASYLPHLDAGVTKAVNALAESERFLFKFDKSWANIICPSIDEKEHHMQKNQQLNKFPSFLGRFFVNMCLLIAKFFCASHMLCSYLPSPVNLLLSQNCQSSSQFCFVKLVSE